MNTKNKLHRILAWQIWQIFPVTIRLTYEKVQQNEFFSFSSVHLCQVPLLCFAPICNSSMVIFTKITKHLYSQLFANQFNLYITRDFSVYISYFWSFHTVNSTICKQKIQINLKGRFFMCLSFQDNHRE